MTFFHTDFQQVKHLILESHYLVKDPTKISLFIDRSYCDLNIIDAAKTCLAPWIPMANNSKLSRG